MSKLHQTSYLPDPEISDYADNDRRKANSQRYGKDVSTTPFRDSGYVAEFDAARLTGQMSDIFALMRDGKFRTLTEVQEAIGRGAETGISASLRSFRKKQYGGHTVNKRRRGDPKRGLFEYSLIIKGDK